MRNDVAHFARLAAAATCCSKRNRCLHLKSTIVTDRGFKTVHEMNIGGFGG